MTTLQTFDWLDVQVDTTQRVTLFGTVRERVVQFRYLSHNTLWHLGYFGELEGVENYAPYKNDRTYRKKPPKPTRPLITACASTESVNHEYPSRTAYATPQTSLRICRRCRGIITEYHHELAELCEYDPEDLNQLADHVHDYGTAEQFQIVCLVDAFEGLAL